MASMTSVNGYFSDETGAGGENEIGRAHQRVGSSVGSRRWEEGMEEVTRLTSEFKRTSSGESFERGD